MKKLIKSFAVASFSLSILAVTGCTSAEEEGTTDSATTSETPAETPTEGEETEELYKVGMITDSGTIDDKSFNQGTWEGIKKYESENKTIETNYVQPVGEETADYLTSIDNLVESGHQMIITPGFKFEQAIYEAQTQYPEQKFVIIDGYPHNGDYIQDVKENTTAILFAEQEAGFYAGVTAALTTKTNKVAFIGGVKVPAVEKFGEGFVMGVAYANSVYGTKAQVTDYIYQGTFTDVTGGQTLSAGFYENDVDIIFSAAGGVGVGVINEAKARRTNGEDVWAIGVDIDQYEQGKMTDGKSAVLTSAVKGIDEASYNMIDSALKSTWEGGQVITFDSSKNGVGLPDDNPNMSEEAKKAYEETFTKVASGEVVVPVDQEEVDKFLVDNGYENTINFEE